MAVPRRRGRAGGGAGSRGSNPGTAHRVSDIADMPSGLEAKHPSREHVDDEPAQPRRKPAGPRNIYTIGGFADAIDDRESIDDDAEADA